MTKYYIYETPSELVNYEPETDLGKEAVERILVTAIKDHIDEVDEVASEIKQFIRWCLDD